MSDQLTKLDHNGYTLEGTKGSLVNVQVEAVYTYKGHNVGFLEARAMIENHPDFENTSYGDVKETLTKALEIYIFSDKFLLSAQELHWSREPFEKSFGLTFMKAKKDGDLSVRILRIRVDNIEGFLKLHKKEKQDAAV